MTTLSETWRAAGIERGGVCLLHASSKRTLRENKITPQELLETFLDAVGPDGTLVLPCFTFKCAHGVPFNLNLPSEMGILGNTALQDGFSRTRHPVYSVAVRGYKEGYFQDVCPFNAFGPMSAFDVLMGADAKIGVLDLDEQSSMTTLHHVEFTVGVSYRATKTFWSGDTVFRLFVHGDGIETHVNPMGELLWEKKLYRGDRPHVRSGLRTIRARDVFNETARVIREGRAEGMLYRRVTT